jgi:hypothetical protein
MIRKETYTLQLTQHQARGLNAALAIVNQLFATPTDTPVYPTLMTQGIELPLITDEMKLLHADVIRQFEEQDKK